MTDNQQARDFFPRLFSDCEAKIVGGLMSSYVLLSRGTVTGYSPSGFVFVRFFLIAYGLLAMSADQYSTNIIFYI